MLEKILAFADTRTHTDTHTNTHTPCSGLEGVGGCEAGAGVDENAKGSDGGEDHKDPQEHAVHHHGYILPVLPQLGRGAGAGGGGGGGGGGRGRGRGRRGEEW